MHLFTVKRLRNVLASEYQGVWTLHKSDERILLSRSFKRKRSLNMKPGISKQDTEKLQYGL